MPSKVILNFLFSSDAPRNVSRVIIIYSPGIRCWLGLKQVPAQSLSRGQGGGDGPPGKLGRGLAPSKLSDGWPNQTRVDPALIQQMDSTVLERRLPLAVVQTETATSCTPKKLQ